MQEPTTPSSNPDSGDAASGRDADGVRIVERDPTAKRRTLAYQLLALFFVAASAGYLLMPKRVPASSKVPPPRGEQAKKAAPADAPSATAATAATDPEGKAAAGTVAAGAAAPGTASNLSTRSLTPRRKAATKKPDTEDSDPGDPDQQPELVGIDRNVTMGEYIQALHDAGIHEGIGAFNPPGTSPPLIGLAVPEDYEIPEGYVRHYQATDDGQAIEPILMFGDPSEYDFYDANGNRIQIPDDRVVPPELAPPGFPIRRIEMPPPREPGGDLGR